MTEPIRIGIVGAGAIVRDRHVPNLRKIDGVELVSVCNQSRESSERAAKEFGIPKVYDSWWELVHADDIDVVWIGTWPYMHKPVTLEAFNTGKHVFCQARMTMNLSDAKEMLDASKKTDRVSMLCPPPMGMKGDRLMKKLIHEDGVLGVLYTIHFQALSAGLIDPETPLHWRQREELSGVNALTVGIYAEIIHRWFGYTKSITAEAKTFIPERPTQEGPRKPVIRPDVVFCLCEMENGALMRCEWSGLARPTSGDQIEAYGSKAALRYNFTTDEIHLSKEGAPWQKQEIPTDLAKEWTVEQDFIDSIRTGKEIHPDFYDGVKYMEFTEGVFRAVEGGRRVELPLD